VGEFFGFGPSDLFGGGLTHCGGLLAIEGLSEEVVVKVVVVEMMVFLKCDEQRRWLSR
jgi:hypothetical protein